MGILQQFGATLASADLSDSMTATARSFWKALLNGLAWVLFAVAGLTFLAGGKVISESAKMDRMLAEMLGLLIAFALGAVGYVLKNFADDLGSDQDSPSQ